ncbi:MAG: radical SAM protein [Bacteriovoracaceae bacterium]|nr:radical SAM protein [Bacteriovoracaceae bacterium]
MEGKLMAIPLKGNGSGDFFQLRDSEGFIELRPQDAPFKEGFLGTVKNTMKSLMTDEYGRIMRKLRVSLLDACNFRCNYCMPSSATFAKVHDLLSPDEIQSIVSNLTTLGIEEVRLTGGEPTLRAELVEIAERLSALPLKRLGLKTMATEVISTGLILDLEASHKASSYFRPCSITRAFLIFPWKKLLALNHPRTRNT